MGGEALRALKLRLHSRKLSLLEHSELFPRCRSHVPSLVECFIKRKRSTVPPPRWSGLTRYSRLKEVIHEPSREEASPSQRR